MACEYEINEIAFQQYCEETAHLYVSLYKWYPMPVIVHKILMHSASIFSSFLIPIGQFSEDVQESRHKEFRNFREYHTRKHYPVNSNIDILYNLLISSDPFITSLKFKNSLENKISLDKHVLKLLKDSNNFVISSEKYRESDPDDYISYNTDNTSDTDD